MRFFIALLAALSLATPVQASSRIKDIVNVEGIRDNQLTGMGLVVGLNGTGDSTRNSPFMQQALEAMLEEFNISTSGTTMTTRNVAAVLITADLPAFATPGTRLDVTVSALGDASSLQGGTLVMSPLRAANGDVYAVASGGIAVGGFAAEGDGATITRGVPTNGRIANGGIVERETGFSLSSQESLRLSLRNPDITTALRMVEAINAYLGSPAAHATDSATITLTRPSDFEGDMVVLLAEIEQLRVQPDLPARVIIDEATGTIVMGEDVRVSTVAIAQGNLTISVSESPIASQPAPFSDGETVVLPRTDVSVEEDQMQMGVLDGGVSLRELVDGLNAMGVSPRDMITILQAIKASGALQADIVVL
ncbi:MAG: flagellar basal body P-ring protein FlgI [Maricaulis sp.]|jgi:flagellar P-ring protein precursor FlgI|nr:flagellar basal body P-ring protein FlgI [Maricaulis sp.]MDG2044465.1 flagellar basal body P-ring protein FlgI [Maricaulis sp.]